MYATTAHIKNTAARATIDALRAKYSGLNKVYGSRYLEALAKFCGYRVAYSTLTIAGVNREFKTNKEAGLYMEGTIESWYELGIK